MPLELDNFLEQHSKAGVSEAFKTLVELLAVFLASLETFRLIRLIRLPKPFT